MSDVTEGGGSGAQTVAAVVVTYNRKELLKRCLEALLAQTRPVDRIVIVDNCSTDGTPEFLEAEGFLQEPVVEYVRLPENMGGAGGFHEGMKRAYEQGYDWLWVMDDDGVPAAEALSRLVDCPLAASIRGCAIVLDDDVSGERLVFITETPSGIIRRVEELEHLSGQEGAVETHGLPFNGVLISNKVIEKIGLPKKEFFIWGDDLEFFLRARRAGFQPIIVVGARFFHPPERTLQKKVYAGILSFSLHYSDDPFRFYLLVRNHTFISLRYDGLFSKRFLKLVMYPLVFPGRTLLIMRAWFEGLTGRMALVRPKAR